MDYPHPYITLIAMGMSMCRTHMQPVSVIGTRLRLTWLSRIRAHTTAGEQRTALDKILTDADHAGQVFITDEDARPFGSAHPRAHLWDNGDDPAAELDVCLRCVQQR